MKKYLYLILLVVTFSCGPIPKKDIPEGYVFISKQTSIKNLTSQNLVVEIKPKEQHVAYNSQLTNPNSYQKNCLKNTKIKFELNRFGDSGIVNHGLFKGRDGLAVSNHFYKENLFYNNEDNTTDTIHLKSILIYDEATNFIVKLTNIAKLKSQLEFDELSDDITIYDEIRPNEVYIYSFDEIFTLTDETLTDKTLGTTKKE